MTSITQILPVELISAIIEFVADLDLDKNKARKSHIPVINPFSNVQACSLTCRAFLPHSRKHIFRSIGLICYCGADPYSKESFSQAESLLTLLTQTSEIGHYVQDLQLILWSPGLPEANNCTSLPSTLEKLTDLRTIHFWHPGEVDFDWQAMPTHLRLSLLQSMRLPTVTSLRFSGITNFTLSSLIHCKALRTLEFRSADVVMVEPVGLQESLLAQTPAIQLTRIVLNTQHIGAILSRLLGQTRSDGNRIFSFGRLETFSAHLPLTMQDAHTVATFLQNVPSVKDLRFTFIYSLTTGPALSSILHCANALKSLTLDINMDAHVVIFSGICNALEEIASKSRLEMLTLKISTLACGRVEEDRWQALEKALLIPGWSCLRHVNFVIDTFSGSLLNKTIGDLPQKQLQHLSTSKSFAFKMVVRQIW